MTTIQRLTANLKRAETVHAREQQRGALDISVQQTRRMALAAMALMRASAAYHRERASQQIFGR